MRGAYCYVLCSASILARGLNVSIDPTPLPAATTTRPPVVVSRRSTLVAPRKSSTSVPTILGRSSSRFSAVKPWPSLATARRYLSETSLWCCYIPRLRYPTSLDSSHSPCVPPRCLRFTHRVLGFVYSFLYPPPAPSPSTVFRHRAAHNRSTCVITGSTPCSVSARTVRRGAWRWRTAGCPGKTCSPWRRPCRREPSS